MKLGFLACVALLGTCHAMSVTQEVSDDDVPGFAFVAKFCYDHAPAGVEVGTMQVTVHKNAACSKADMDVLIYSDEEHRWPSIYDRGFKDGLTCEKMREAANNWVDGKIISDKYTIKFAEGQTTFVTPVIQILESARPRFWYVVIANCENFAEIEVEGVFLNTMNGGWSEAFGVDETGLNTLYLIFFMVYVGLVATQMFSVKTHWSNQKYVHPMLKVFTILLFIEFVSIIMFLAHYCAYTNDGAGFIAVRHTAEVLDILSKVMFMMLLLLLARGWTISTEELTGKREVLGTGGVFLMLYCLMLLWKYAIDDPAATEVSIPYFIFQLIVTVLWIVFAGYFLLTTLRSWKTEDNEAKQGLYLKLGGFYGVWFLGLPLLTWLVYILDPWVRDVTVQATSICITTLAYAIMVFLFWPSRAADYFAISTPSTATMEHYNEL